MITIFDISWCVPFFDRSYDNRVKLQIALRGNSDCGFYERKIFYKSFPDSSNFLFDLGMESGMERPQYILVCFEKNNVDEQTHDASIFDVIHVTECYCKIVCDF